MSYSSRYDYPPPPPPRKDYDDHSRPIGPPPPPPEDNPFSKPVASTKIDFDKYDEIPVEASGRDCPAAIEAWKDADIGSAVLKNIEAAKYDRPTPVQKHSIPIVLKGRDLMGCAQTGSGKTAAFLLPIIANMTKRGLLPGGRDFKAYPSALVLAPTRELASQIYDEARKFSYNTGLKCVVVYGGTPIHGHLRDLGYGCDLLVATPGRLSDIMDRGRVSLSRIQYLVLDEADRMLDMGFEPQIRKIVEQADMPKTGHRQTLMFSATFAKDIQRLAATFLHDYIFLAVGRVGSTTDFITQKFIRTNTERDKETTLMQLLSEMKGLTLIFVETKKKASQLDYMLNRRGLPVSSIHGDKAQTDRTTALRNFSTGRTPILIATNVAARGLDISNVVHVINYDMPNNIDDYVHRIGRTGRAGKTGVSTAFIGEEDSGVVPKVLQILHETGQEIPPWLQSMGYYKKPSSSKGGYKFGGKDFRLKQSGGYGGSHQDNNNTSHYRSNYNSMPPSQPAPWTPVPPPSSAGSSSSASTSAYGPTPVQTAGAQQPQYNPYYMQYYQQYGYQYPSASATPSAPSTSTPSSASTTARYPPTSYSQYNGYSSAASTATASSASNQPVLYPQPPPSLSSASASNGTASTSSHADGKDKDSSRNGRDHRSSKERDSKSSSHDRYSPSRSSSSKRKYSDDSDDDYKEKKHRSSSHHSSSHSSSSHHHHHSSSSSSKSHSSKSRSRSRSRERK